MFETSDWEYECRSSRKSRYDFCAYDFRNTVIQRDVDITPCTNLDSLTIDFTTSTQALSFLHGVRAKTLRTLSFNVSLRELKPDPDFATLSHSLQEAQFSTVNQLRFIQHGDLPIARVERIITSAMPDLHARAALRVVEMPAVKFMGA